MSFGRFQHHLRRESSLGLHGFRPRTSHLRHEGLPCVERVACILRRDAVTRGVPFETVDPSTREELLEDAREMDALLPDGTFPEVVIMSLGMAQRNEWREHGVALNRDRTWGDAHARPVLSSVACCDMYRRGRSEPIRLRPSRLVPARPTQGTESGSGS